MRQRRDRYRDQEHRLSPKGPEPSRRMCTKGRRLPRRLGVLSIHKVS